VVTVMSPAGDSAVRAHIQAGPDIVTTGGGGGQLTQYQGKRRDALERLIETNGIIVLDKLSWDAKKAQLGEAIRR
jgi:hypothetical protein